MKIRLDPMSAGDREAVMEIFNYYVENSFAAYPDERMPREFFDTLLGMCQGYPTAVARDERGEVVGFGVLRAYHPFSTFSKTAEIGYFIEPDHTGHGIGKMLLDHLVDGARRQGITQILASISSLNEGSVRFHLQNGFVECGRFRAIGHKHGKDFDVVYCQRTL